MIQWKDTTGYSRDERGRVEPRTWEIQSGTVRIIVTRFLRQEGWFLLCYEVGISNHFELRSRDLADAQREAIAKVRATLANRLAYVDKLVEREEGGGR